MSNIFTRNLNKLENGVFDGLGEISGSFGSFGRGVKDTVGDVYNDATGVTEVRKARDQETAGLNEANQLTRDMYDQAKGYLDPYQAMGKNSMNLLYNGIMSGQFSNDQFQYDGSRPEFNYNGSIPDSFNPNIQGFQKDLRYYGHQGAGVNYRGQPVSRSIESYMQDDPSLAWQQEQLQKQIDRSGAAQGRWGGGATLRESNRGQSGLLSQDYNNRFNRAYAERNAAVGSEQDMYGRALTNLGLANQAEQSNYNRALSQRDINNQANQNNYERSFDTYNTGVQREADNYNRQMADFGVRSGNEQDAYNRYANSYSINSQNKQNLLSQYQGLANMGPQMAQSIANAAVGQGSQLANLAIQQGNVNAASTMAQGNPFSNLLNLAGQGLDVYGKYKGATGGKK